MTQKLKLSIGRTYNLGNYESLRLDVGLEREVETNMEEHFEDMRIDLEKELQKLENRHGIGK